MESKPDILDFDVFGFFDYNSTKTDIINLWLEQFSITSLRCLYYLANLKKYKSYDSYIHEPCICNNDYNQFYTSLITNASFPKCTTNKLVTIPKYNIPAAEPFIGFTIGENYVLNSQLVVPDKLLTFERPSGVSLNQYFDWYTKQSLPTFLDYLFLTKLQSKKKALAQIVPPNWRETDRKKFRYTKTSATQPLDLWLAYKSNINLAYNDINMFCIWKKRPTPTNVYIDDDCMVQYKYTVPIVILDSIDDICKIFDLYGNLLKKKKKQKINTTLLVACMEDHYVILDIYRLGTVNIFQFPLSERLPFINKFIEIGGSKFVAAPQLSKSTLKYEESNYYKQIAQQSAFNIPYDGFIFKTNNQEFSYKFNTNVLRVYSKQKTHFIFDATESIPAGLVIPASLPPYSYKFLCCLDGDCLNVLIFDAFRFRVYFTISSEHITVWPTKFTLKHVDFARGPVKKQCFVAKIYFNSFAQNAPNNIVAIIANPYYSLYDVMSAFRFSAESKLGNKFWKDGSH